MPPSHENTQIVIISNSDKRSLLKAWSTYCAVCGLRLVYENKILRCITQFTAFKFRIQEIKLILKAHDNKSFLEAHTEFSRFSYIHESERNSERDKSPRR